VLRETVLPYKTGERFWNCRDDLEILLIGHPWNLILRGYVWCFGVDVCWGSWVSREVALGVVLLELGM
jgi:hypothetical protein